MIDFVKRAAWRKAAESVVLTGQTHPYFEVFGALLKHAPLPHERIVPQDVDKVLAVGARERQKSNDSTTV